MSTPLVAYNGGATRRIKVEDCDKDESNNKVNKKRRLEGSHGSKMSLMRSRGARLLLQKKKLASLSLKCFQCISSHFCMDLRFIRTHPSYKTFKLISFLPNTLNFLPSTLFLSFHFQYNQT